MPEKDFILRACRLCGFPAMFSKAQLATLNPDETRGVIMCSSPDCINHTPIFDLDDFSEIAEWNKATERHSSDPEVNITTLKDFPYTRHILEFSIDSQAHIARLLNGRSGPDGSVRYDGPKGPRILHTGGTIFISRDGSKVVVRE